MKIALGADRQDQHQPLKAGLCGATAATAHDFFMNPFDVIKQRMQLGYYQSTFHCMKTILRTEGASAFYVSFPTTLMTNIPHGCLVVAANESARTILNPSGKYSVTSSLIAGSIAGGFAAACTTPLDVIKTRLQTQDLVPCMELENEVKHSGCYSQNTSSGSGSSGGHQQCNNSSGSGCSNSSSSSSNSSSHNNNSNGGVNRLNLSQSPDLLNRGRKMHYHTFPEMSVNNSVSSNSPFQALRNNYRMIRQVVQRIISEEGYAGLWRGMGPRVVNQAPAVAISWTVYEGAKSVFGWRPRPSGVSSD